MRRIARVVTILLAVFVCATCQEECEEGKGADATGDVRDADVLMDAAGDTGGPDTADGAADGDGEEGDARDTAGDTVGDGEGGGADVADADARDADTTADVVDGGDGGDGDAMGGTGFLDRSDSRAMWVWSGDPTAQELLTNAGGAQDALFQFVAAPHGEAARAIDRLFFEAREKATTSGDRKSELFSVTYDPLTQSPGQGDLRSFLKRAHQEGVEVEYLDGQAIWLATDEHAEVPKDICESFVAFNESAGSREAMFDGIHLDIEPHTVTSGPYGGEWWENRLPDGYNREWTARWKEILNACRATLDAFEQRTGHHMTLSSDLGADYSHYNAPLTSFLNDPNGPLDYVTVMNYYDNRANRDGDPSFFYGADDGNMIVGGVRENLAGYDQLPVLFGLETGPPSIAKDEASFYQEGYRAMYGVVDRLFADYGDRNLAGAAFHHYAPKAYRAMSP